MVVPIVNCDTKSSSNHITNTNTNKNKKIVGNGKLISMQKNSSSLVIIGNGNSVDIERNDGDIKVMGDGCRISITTGTGSLEYIGDGGVICAGNMNSDRIRYKGDGGIIKGQNHESCKLPKNKKTIVPNIYVNNNKVSSNIKIGVCDIRKIIGAIHIPKIDVRTR